MVHTSAKHALSNICKELDLSSKTYSLFHILGNKASRMPAQKIGVRDVFIIELF